MGKTKPDISKTFQQNIRKRLAVLGDSIEARCREHYPMAVRRDGTSIASDRFRRAARRDNPGLVLVGQFADLLGCRPYQLLDPDWNGQA